MTPRPGAGSATTRLGDAGLDAGMAHLLQADPVLGAIVQAHGPLDLEQRRRGRPPDAYGALLRSIIGQQLSTKAAATIYGRLAALYGDRAPTPQELLDTEPDRLRAVGLSGAKATYVRSLAEHVLAGELNLGLLPDLPDNEVAAQLTSVKGLGQWTADMFLIFHLGRADVLPVGDLGVRRAVQIAYGLDALPKPAALTLTAEPWRPHRSLAALYLWRSLDNEPGT